MINKKLGYVIISLAVLLGIFLFYIHNALSYEADQLGCFEPAECRGIATSFAFTNLSFGIVGFVLALGTYLVAFYKGEEEIIKHIENQKNNDLRNQKFDIILSALNDDEKKVLTSIREQEGVSQSTLYIRLGISKSKLSELLKILEKKNLVKKQKKGKTNYLYLGMYR